MGLGIEGYGIFFMVLEVLREQADYKYPLEDIDILANDFGTSEQKVRTVVCNYKLFQVDENEKFFSTSLIHRMQPLHRQREQRSIAGKASAAKRMLNDRSTTVQLSKVKESKVKEIKESKVNKIDIPALDEFLEYCKTVVDLSQYEFPLKAKYEAWLQAGWKDGNGKSIKNWKTKIKNTVPYLKPFKKSESGEAAKLNFLLGK